MPRREAAISVTTAQRSHTEDIGHRQRNYLITMAVRTGALVLAVVLPVPVPFRLALALASVVLPWLAVTYANGGQVRGGRNARLLDHPQRLVIDPERTVDSSGDR